MSGIHLGCDCAQYNPTVFACAFARVEADFLLVRLSENSVSVVPALYIFDVIEPVQGELTKC